MVLLQPKYRPIVQTQPAKVISIQQWSTESIERLRSEFDCTVWEVFTQSAQNIDQLTETISDYINFCTDLYIPKKCVKVFSNNKPWITKNVKEIINRKKQVL